MKFILKNIGLICLFVLLILPENAYTQVKTNMITKEIIKTFTISSKTKIVIDAEKADFQITASKNNEFKMNLKLISSNTDIKIAKEQLACLHHIIRDTKQEITIRNFIMLSNNNEISGSIKAVYTLEIPANIYVNIKNTLGDINVSGVIGNYTMDIKFGNLVIKESMGDFDITQHIGDLFIHNSKLLCKLNLTNVSNNFKNIKGSFNIKSNMGSINFELNKSVTVLTIMSVGTEINISNTECIECNWDIVAESGIFYINDCYIKDKTKILLDTSNKKFNKIEFRYYLENPSSRIKIQNKYSNIYIN